MHVIVTRVGVVWRVLCTCVNEYHTDGEDTGLHTESVLSYKHVHVNTLILNLYYFLKSPPLYISFRPLLVKNIVVYYERNKVRGKETS